MKTLNEHYYQLPNSHTNIKRAWWKLPLLIIFSPVVLTLGFFYTLTQYIVTNISLQAKKVSKQKDIHPLFLSKDDATPEMYVVNLRPQPVAQSAWRHYWKKFQSFIFHIPLHHESADPMLSYNRPDDLAHVNRMVEEIRKASKETNWDWGKVYFKGMECLDRELKAHFIAQLKEKTHYDLATPIEHKYSLNFFTLGTDDGVLLDSVEIANPSEQDIPMSERKFIIRGLARKENFINKIKDALGILETDKQGDSSINPTFIYFNWRGNDYSTGKVWTPDDMAHDMIAQVQRLLALGAKPENIGLTGTSLGAAIATLATAKLHESGINIKTYNERSFRSYIRTIVGYFHPAANSSALHPKNWWRYPVIGIIYLIVAPCVWLTGWAMDVVSAWKKIPYDDKDYCVIRDGETLMSETGKEDGSLDDHHTALYSYIVSERQALEKKQESGMELSEEEQKLLQDDLVRHFVTIDPKQKSSVKEGTPPHVLDSTYFVQLKDKEQPRPKKLYDLMLGYFQKQLGRRPLEDADIVQKFLGKKYTYNPHRHVKIWMTNNPDVFMNFENQVRLIEMRQTNPKDEIALVYSSSLLSEEAKDAFAEFCKAYHINAIDADSDEFKANLKGKHEEALYKFYQDEIQHLKEGGNLAVASDILRWLSPVYSLGTYSDFDYPIDTNHLPETIEVDAPILINLGSFGIGNKQIVISNNDFIAVVNKEIGAKKIDDIQKALLEALRNYKSNFIPELENRFKSIGPISHRLMLQMKNRLETLYHEKSNTLKDKSNEKTSRGVRKFLQEVMTDQKRYLDFARQSGETDLDVILRLRSEFKKQLGLIKWLFFRREYYEIKTMLAEKDEVFLKKLMKKERNFYLKAIVVDTAGPITLTYGLFGAHTCDIKQFDANIQRFATQHYGLEHAFQSRNIMGLRQNLMGTLQFISEDEGDHNDSSWLESGAKMLKMRGNILVMRQAVLAKQLPVRLKDIKEKVEQYQAQLTKKYNHWLYSPVKHKFQQEITYLNDILSCFTEDTFDGAKYDALIAKSRAPAGFLYRELFFGQSQPLFQDLELACKDASSCYLAVHEQVSLSTPAKILTALSVPKNDLLDQLDIHIKQLEQDAKNAALVEALRTLYTSAEKEIAAEKGLGWTDKRIIEGPTYSVLQETLSFLDKLKDISLEEGETDEAKKVSMLDAIKAYDCQCYALTRRSSLERAVKMIIAAAVGLVLGLVIGGAIGLAAGIWTGPGAIVTALIGVFKGAWTGAVLGLAAGAGVSGVATTAVTRRSAFFKPHFMYDLGHKVAEEYKKIGISAAP